MAGRLGFRLRQHVHDLSNGLWFVPVATTTVVGIVAVALVELELDGTLPPLTSAGALFRGDPGSAQVVLGAIAGSMMAVISIVYSVLVVALSLASMQYSPRIVSGYVRDRPSQFTLGIFIGTFTYCLIVLRSIQSDPPRVPTWGVNGGILLALASIGFLIYFIHNIASGIQANYLVARIARDTSRLIPGAFPAQAADDDAPPTIPTDATRVEASGGGYLQLFDLEGLVLLAQQHDVVIHLGVRPGDFVRRGEPLAWIEPEKRATPELVGACKDAFDLGSTRTMQQDVAFGVRQIVDCALKAISPAVNDPSTAATCIDQLGDLLVQVARRHDRPHVVRDGSALRLIVPFPRLVELVDLAFNQLRQYGRTDISVSIRMLQSLAAIAGARRNERDCGRIEQHAIAIRDALSSDFLAVDRASFDAQFERFERAFAGSRTSSIASHRVELLP